MFESHFGLSGPPFQLNADPAFFFGSRGHSHALAYMRFGVHQAEGFIVVTGEVGAGKTTLVRTLMSSLEQERVVAAQVVSTQLEAGDLLRAILAAFGVSAPATASKAQLISSLEAFLTALAAQGRRALLVIDEAQNLDREAVEELRMLSNFQLGTHGLLQSFLVGQPELRQLLQSRSMEQLRQRVIASCHLGPLEPAETRSYIVHRLKHVGWQDRPHFTDEAFEQIHRATGGIPRRINRLCGRLMLGAFLAGREDVAAEHVLEAARELNAEIGETEPVLSGITSTVSAPVAKQDIDVVARAVGRQRGAVLYWVESLTDYLKAGALAKAFATDPAMPLLVAVHAGNFERLLKQLDDGETLPRPDVDIGLCASDEPGADRAATLARAVGRFGEVVAERSPSAFIVGGSSDAAMLCALLADRCDVPVVRFDAGRVQRGGAESPRTNTPWLDRLAEWIYTENLVSYHALHKAGVAQDRLQCVGDLIGDVLHLADARLPSAEDVLKAIGPAAQRLRRGVGYGVVTAGFDPRSSSAVRLEQLVAVLAQCASERPLLWWLDDAAIDALKAMGIAQRLGATDLVVVPRPSYFQALGLLRQAELCISEPAGAFLEEAIALGLACATIDRDGSVAVRGSDPEASRSTLAMVDLPRLVRDMRAARSDSAERRAAWDGGAAARITAHLGARWRAVGATDGAGRRGIEGAGS